MSYAHKNITTSGTLSGSLRRHVCISFLASLLGGLQLLDLLDEIGLLIVELLVLGPVGVELGEEVNELVLVAQQYVQYRLRFVRIRDEDLDKYRFIISKSDNDILIIKGP